MKIRQFGTSAVRQSRFRRNLALALFLVLSRAALPQSPIGEVFASDATVQGSVQLTRGGTKVLSGANVSAGDAAARLQLARGGELRLCPRTSVAVSASASGRELLFAMGTGALEADYRLDASADTIMTPDFRILLAGPGTFHFALRSRPNGDTCFQARASNTSSLVVTEVMGDATYQVKPNERVLFRKGSLAAPEPDPPEDCGCPPPAPTEVAAAAPPPAAAATGPALVAAKPLPRPEDPPPAPDPGAVHVQVESPFVFRAEDLPVIGPPPEPARSSLVSLPVLSAAPALPPPATIVAAPRPEKKKKGALARLRSFFASIFK